MHQSRKPSNGPNHDYSSWWDKTFGRIVNSRGPSRIGMLELGSSCDILNPPSDYQRNQQLAFGVEKPERPLRAAGARLRRARSSISSAYLQPTSQPEISSIEPSRHSRMLSSPNLPQKGFSYLADETTFPYSNTTAQLGQSTVQQSTSSYGSNEKSQVELESSLKLNLLIASICLAAFMTSMDRSIITTVRESMDKIRWRNIEIRTSETDLVQAIPKITADFKSYADSGWYGSAYLLTACTFQPLYGRLYMKLDVKGIYLGAVAMFGAGSLLCGIAPNSPILILGRAIQGLGSAGVLTGSFVVGSHSVPLQQRPILFAGVGVIYGAGSLCGPLLGGVFTDLATWRWCCRFHHCPWNERTRVLTPTKVYANLPTTAITAVCVMTFFRPRHRVEQTFISTIKTILQLDIIGNVILLSASSMLFLALQLSENPIYRSSTPVIGFFTGFVLTTILFVVWMWYRGEAALIPLRFVRERTLFISSISGFCTYAALVIYSFYLPIWFQAVKGTTAIQSGLNMVPFMLANTLSCLVAGVFVSKKGTYAHPAVLGCAISTVGAGLFTTFQPSTSTTRWVLVELLTSCGFGMAIQQGFNAVQATMSLEEVPIGTAIVVASQSFGGAISVSIGNMLIQDYLLDTKNEKRIPGVDVQLVLQKGAADFRAFVPKALLPALIDLYNDALRKTFVTATIMAGLAFIASLGMKWRSSLRKT